MWQRAISGSGGGSQAKDYYIKLGANNISDYYGEYTIGNTVSISNGGSTIGIVIMFGEPKSLYIYANSGTTRVLYEDGTSELIGKNKTFKSNIIGATVVTGSSISLTASTT